MYRFETMGSLGWIRGSTMELPDFGSAYREAIFIGNHARRNDRFGVVDAALRVDLLGSDDQQLVTIYPAFELPVVA